MRHGRKSSSHRFNGHKAQVAVDTDSQLITAVEVLPGDAPDAEHALDVVDASEAVTGWQVEEVIGDCAYGAGETRAQFAASGRIWLPRFRRFRTRATLSRPRRTRSGRNSFQIG
jgi:hypothetical protein